MRVVAVSFKVLENVAGHTVLVPASDRIYKHSCYKKRKRKSEKGNSITIAIVITITIWSHSILHG